MNNVQLTVLVAIALFPVLMVLFRKRKGIALGYLRYVVLSLTAVVMLAPFVWLLISAFKDSSVLMQYTFLPPFSEWSNKTINLKSFQKLFAGEQTQQGTVYFWQYMLNSLFLTSASTAAQLFFSSLGGFALAVYSFKGRSYVLGFMLSSMMVPSMILLAPIYGLIYRLGWMDTYWALIVPGMASAFGMFLFRQAILGVPVSLLEAARIDGCSEFRIYYNIVMPLVKPMTAAFCLITFLGTWNSFLGPQIFLKTQAKLTLPVVLSQYVNLYRTEYGVFLAGTLLAIIPPALLFFAFQREFVAGLTKGAVKG